MKQASRKSKGTRLEKWVQERLAKAGLRARRQPGSGIYSDFPHDVFLELGGNNENVKLVIECKSWKNGWRTGDSALGKADLLVIKRDYGEPCVYMPWPTFQLLAHIADAYFKGIEASSEDRSSEAFHVEPDQDA